MAAHHVALHVHLGAGDVLLRDEAEVRDGDLQHAARRQHAHPLAQHVHHLRLREVLEHVARAHHFRASVGDLGERIEAVARLGVERAIAVDRRRAAPRFSFMLALAALVNRFFPAASR
jgi:hypothetical protein